VQRGLIALVGLLSWSLSADEAAKNASPGKPPWQRYLQGEDARRAAEQEKELAQLQQAGRLTEALQVAEALAELRSRKQGTDHWQAVDARMEVEVLRRVLRQSEQGQKDYARSLELHRQGIELLNRGRYREAQPLLENVLALHRSILGEEHPHTAASCSNLALNQNAQGKYVAAEEGFRKALAICHKALGDEHHQTAQCYNSLALNQQDQGKYAAAEVLWLRAASSFARARLRIAPSGLERATITSERSPLPSLAAVLARNGKPEEAWQRFEESLARGTWDDLSARLRRPAAEQAKQTDIVNRLNRLDLLIENTLSASVDTPERKTRRDDLLTRRRQTQEELDAFAHHLEETYGPAAGQVFERKQIQKALPADAALIGWLDLPGAAGAADPSGEHWTVLLRSVGEPVWVRISGSGDKHAWTEADTQLPAQVRAALQDGRSDWQPLSRRLRKQRL
jgi:hypothetical protein